VGSMLGKKIWGRKRHILVDTQGFLLAATVHSAGVVDCHGARLLLEPLVGRFPRLTHLFADNGYRGVLTQWIKDQLNWTTEIVPYEQTTTRIYLRLVDGQPQRVPNPAKNPKGGFQVQRKRWVVERTFAWLTRWRRLARDYEGLPSSSEAFIQIASICLLLTRLVRFRS
jgi:transposase